MKMIYITYKNENPVDKSKLNFIYSNSINFTTYLSIAYRRRYAQA